MLWGKNERKKATTTEHTGVCVTYLRAPARGDARAHELDLLAAWWGARGSSSDASATCLPFCFSSSIFFSCRCFCCCCCCCCCCCVSGSICSGSVLRLSLPLASVTVSPRTAEGCGYRGCYPWTMCRRSCAVLARCVCEVKGRKKEKLEPRLPTSNPSKNQQNGF
jgi:hypothetical protein